MADNREITIVIRAQDEFSDVLERAGQCADKNAAKIQNSFRGSDNGGDAARLGEYATALERVMGLESSRAATEEKSAALRELNRLRQESPYDAGKKPATYGEDQETVRIALAYQKQLESLRAYNTQVVQEKIRSGASQAEIEASYAELSIQYEQKKRDFQIHAASGAAGAMANFMQNLYVATGSKNKALFEMMKAFSIARAMISGTEAAVSAYAWGAFFGGPPLGAAFAAMAATATAAQIAQITSLSPGGAGGGISAGGSANPSYHGGSTSAYPVPQTLSQDSKQIQSVVVNIHNPLSDQNWQKVVEDNIIPALNNASDRNVALTVRYA
ncbi:hypothetical protein EPN18_10010 [bacterium]|nr:MAG: hypothetical protein EPN18_10010 [bacterium]